MALRDDLISEEGCVPYAYRDSRGIWTCGVGFNIDKDHGGRIPLPVIDYWLDFGLENAAKLLDKNLPWWRSQPANIQDALRDMVYQMGIGSARDHTGLLSFQDGLARLKLADITGARGAFLDSAWGRETPARCQRVMTRLTQGG